MSLGVKLTSFAAAFVFVNSAFANICPNLSDLQTSGLTRAENIGNDYYVSYSISNFNSPSTWGFAIGPVQANSNKQALDSSNNLLANMSSAGHLLQLDDHTIVCLYDTGNPYIYSIAIKDYLINPMELKQYLQQIHH